MKKIILIAASIVVALAVLLPFASKTPDGLQTLANNNAKQEQPIWNGLMAEYTIAVGNTYVSTLVAGLLGTGIILAAGFALGAATTNKKRGKVTETI